MGHVVCKRNEDAAMACDHECGRYGLYADSHYESGGMEDEVAGSIPCRGILLVCVLECFRWAKDVVQQIITRDSQILRMIDHRSLTYPGKSYPSSYTQSCSTLVP